MPLISANDLEAFAVSLLCQGKLPEDEANIVARSLVGANLRGHDSHGVMRIPYYLQAVSQGDTVPGAPFEILRESGNILVADGHWGLGQVQAHRLLDRLMEMARSQGVAVGTLIHSAHIGRLGEYCEAAAARGLVSMVMVNTHGFARRVAPPGGTAPRLGTNPLAFGIPQEPAPLILDFGTSATAEGKVRVKRIAGEPCPEGWLLDSQGNPTTDPNALYADPPGSIRPMGGDQAYKGFGLALIVEIFAGALSGGVCSREVPINQNGNCVYLQLLNPDAFGGAGHFASEVSGLMRFLRESPCRAGIERITLSGDPELATFAQRSEEGIPLDAGNWQALLDLAEKLQIAPPSVPN